MADKKLAKQLAREQMLIQMRKDTLAREGALDQATLQKIKGKWFDTVIETKVPQMRDNLRYILHYMEKLIEAENYRKLLFEKERDELEDESTLLSKGHASCLETLFDIYEKRIQDLHAAFNGTATEKKERAEAEFDAIDARENLTQENMQTMLYQMHDDRDKKEDMMNCSMFLKLDDERSKNTEIKENLRTRLEKKMEKRWGEISSTLNKYEESTKARRKDYIVLKTKDDADSKIIFQQMKKTQKLFEQLEELKKCMDDCYAPKETMSLITDTREERVKFLETFKKLKIILDDELQHDENNLKALTMATNSVIRDMSQISKKGEQILTMFRICRRLETELEKVLPVGDALNMPKAVLPADLRKRGKSKTEKEEMVHPVSTNAWTKDFEVLDKFWRKVARVRLSKFALTKYIKDVQKENKYLKEALASYLREASKNMRPSFFLIKKSVGFDPDECFSE